LTGERMRRVEQEILARRPEHAIEPTLDRITELAALLGDPQRAYPVIHVAGTNGKTSTARMTETLLRTRGLRTGLFTSPHLSSIRERIAVDGEPLSEEAFAAAYDDVAPYLALVDESQPVALSFFEVLAAMAFAAFADAPVDVAVIEVGIGGTWDATNIADGAVAVVTPVAIDHTQYLGDTIEEIAAEKAGIIKAGAVAVIAQQPVPAAEVLMRRAGDIGASVAREGLEFGVSARELAVGGQRLAIHGLRGDYDDLLLPLFGEYQAGNAACALAAVEAFAGAADMGPAPADQAGGAAGIGPAPAGWPGSADASEVRPEARLRLVGSGDAAPVGRRPGTGAGVAGGQLDPGLVREAFAAMTSPGRLEVVRRSPVLLVDAAHNPAGMAAAMAGLTEAFTFSAVVGVLAVSMDKDVTGILDELEPVLSELVVTRNSSRRSMDPGDLAELAAGVFGPDRVHSAGRLDDALEIAVGLADDAAGEEGLGRPAVLVTGSVITAGDARLLLTAPSRDAAEQG
jgi:dihydrofolate synthase / folylpolyglutamate synthase